MTANDLIHKLTDGRRFAGVCLLSKKQSDWVRREVYKETRKTISADPGIVFGDFKLRTMGRAFSRNRNNSIIHVAHRAECIAERARADREVIERQRAAFQQAWDGIKDLDGPGVAETREQVKALIASAGFPEIVSS